MFKETIDKFLATHGKAAARVVNALARHDKFKTAIETEVGQVLMADCLNRMEAILEKIITEDATPQELAEFRALREIADRWQDRLVAYTKAVKQIAENKIRT